VIFAAAPGSGGFSAEKIIPYPGKKVKVNRRKYGVKSYRAFNAHLE
jgi:hypothetical protein